MSGPFQPLKDLVLEVEIAEPVDTADFELAEPQTFELPGRTVVLKAVKFDIASTLIRYDVILDSDADANAATCWYLVAGPDGKVKNVEWSLSLSASEAETTEHDGKSCTVIHYDLGSDSPVTDLPESLTFISVSELPRQEGEPSTVLLPARRRPGEGGGLLYDWVEIKGSYIAIHASVRMHRGIFT